MKENRRESPRKVVEEKPTFDANDIYLQLEQLYTRVKFVRFDIQEQICDNVQAD